MRRGSKRTKAQVDAERVIGGSVRKPPKAKVQAKRLVAKETTKRKGSNCRASERRLAEALEREKAIGEILKVMSVSPGDVQPVLETVAERAAHLCEAPFATVWLADGDVLHTGAAYSLDGTRRTPAPLPLKRSTVSGRAILDRATVHYEDLTPLLETEYPDAINPHPQGMRAVLGVPLMREDKAYGSIFLFRREPRAFSPDQVALVETFAQQAAIAIDNARLFNETKEALEQQTATSEILRVISSTQTDLAPVFDAIVRAAVRLSGADYSVAARFDGAMLHPLAFHGFTAEALKFVERMFPMAPSRINMLGRAALTREVVIITDMLADPEYAHDYAWVGGWRSGFAVPMLRDGRLLGVLGVSRSTIGGFPDHVVKLLQTFADQAVIAIENVRMFNEVQARTRELSESLQQQTATADVLKVISRSAFDLQTVLDTLTESACKLCEAEAANIWRPDGDGFKIAAMFGHTPEHRAALKRVINRPGRNTCVGRALLEGRTVHIPDAKADPEYSAPGVLAVRGNRAMVGVPLLREESAIGVLVLTRTVARPFTEKQIALATTFANQAVIAIENVRLFNETKEALERQTATSEILRAISQSPTDVQPVFDTIADAAMKLCGGTLTTVARYDGELVHIEALASSWKPEEADTIRRLYPMPPSRGTVASRAVLIRDVVNIPDVQEDAEYTIRDVARSAGYRSAVGVPLMLHGVPIGAIGVGRPQVGMFPEKQIALLKTFADQAVIAIENVRLFNETKEALERQTATSEILRVISQSPRDVQPVFDTIVKSAVRLCEARYGAVFRLDGGLVHLAAHHNLSEKLLAEWFHSSSVSYPMPPNRGHVSGRTILAGAAVQVPDIFADKEYLGAGMKSVGFRSLLGVPLLRGGRAIGAIVIYRMEPGQFADKHVELLQTFADQAVIAVENVRLFTELETRTSQLTQSVEELKALGEVGRAVSSTLDLETVLLTIVSRATQLAGVDGGSIWEYDEAREQFYVRATDRLPDELIEAHRIAPIQKGEGALGRLAMTGEPVEIHDVAEESNYPSHLREILIRCGYRSVLAVPLLREDHLLGALAVNRTTPGEFASDVVALLKTFATQSALAIQNARLYREIEVKSRELEAASRHKSEFLANMSHELRTPLNAIIGFSEVLSERMFGELNEKQTEYIGDILQSGQHLLSLINDILDLSKIEAGRMDLELSEFDLTGAIENTMTLVRERAQRRGITLGRAIAERVGIIRADERKVKQVLLNLLSNALKFTPEGGQINVRAAVQDSVAEVSVADTGVGIAPEDQEKVFEEFRQVGTAAKKVEGTGLGLAISRKFIELHRGKIWVTSKVGSGSTFTFTLPLQ